MSTVAAQPASFDTMENNRMYYGGSFNGSGEINHFDNSFGMIAPEEMPFVGGSFQPHTELSDYFMGLTPDVPGAVLPQQEFSASTSHGLTVQTQSMFGGAPQEQPQSHFDTNGIAIPYPTHQYSQQQNPPPTVTQPMLNMTMIDCIPPVNMNIFGPRSASLDNNTPVVTSQYNNSHKRTYSESQVLQPAAPIKDEPAAPPVKRQRRSRKKAHMASAEEGQAKRDKFLERNRVAASKCRAKKKEWTNGLEERCRHAQHELAVATTLVSSLAQEVVALRGMVRAHGPCDDESISKYFASVEKNDLTLITFSSESTDADVAISPSTQQDYDESKAESLGDSPRPESSNGSSPIPTVEQIIEAQLGAHTSDSCVSSPASGHSHHDSGIDVSPTSPEKISTQIAAMRTDQNSATIAWQDSIDTTFFDEGYQGI